MGDICIRHGVTVIADEIHYGITMPGYTYTPYASLGDKYRDTCIQTASCSKSFNIAGLQIAYIIASDPKMREGVNAPSTSMRPAMSTRLALRLSKPLIMSAEIGSMSSASTLRVTMISLSRSLLLTCLPSRPCVLKAHILHGSIATLLA